MGMSKDMAFESLLLENYSSFILIECKEEFTFKGHYQGIIRARLIKKEQRENICFSSDVGSEFHFQ